MRKVLHGVALMLLCVFTATTVFAAPMAANRFQAMQQVLAEKVPGKTAEIEAAFQGDVLNLLKEGKKDEALAKVNEVLNVSIFKSLSPEAQATVLAAVEAVVKNKETDVAKIAADVAFKGAINSAFTAQGQMFGPDSADAIELGTQVVSKLGDAIVTKTIEGVQVQGRQELLDNAQVEAVIADLIKSDVLQGQDVEKISFLPELSMAAKYNSAAKELVLPDVKLVELSKLYTEEVAAYNAVLNAPASYLVDGKVVTSKVVDMPVGDATYGDVSTLDFYRFYASHELEESTKGEFTSQTAHDDWAKEHAEKLGLNGMYDALTRIAIGDFMVAAQTKASENEAIVNLIKEQMAGVKIIVSEEMLKSILVDQTPVGMALKGLDLVALPSTAVQSDIEKAAALGEKVLLMDVGTYAGQEAFITKAKAAIAAAKKPAVHATFKDLKLFENVDFQTNFYSVLGELLAQAAEPGIVDVDVNTAWFEKLFKNLSDDVVVLLEKAQKGMMTRYLTSIAA